MLPQKHSIDAKLLRDSKDTSVLAVSFHRVMQMEVCTGCFIKTVKICLPLSSHSHRESQLTFGVALAKCSPLMLDQVALTSVK